MSNFLLSVLGSMAAGLLVRGTLQEKVGAAVAASIVGLYGYVLALLGISGIALFIYGVAHGVKRVVTDFGPGAL